MTAPALEVEALDVRYGGVSAVRNESCSVLHDSALDTWTCTGWVEGEEGPFRLLDATSSTIVIADARGLVSHESAWSGTLMWLDGDVVRDVPAGGRRLARRR